MECRQFGSLGFEPIADTELSEQIARLRRIWFHFVPQLAHVDAHVMMLVDMQRTPHFF